MPRTPIRGRNPEGWGEGIVARGLVPRLGRAASSPALHHPAPSHFHPLMRPSQGHGDSHESGNLGEVRVVAMTLELSHQPMHPISYLGVPAPAGMGDWCESMSRTPIRDGSRHRPATPTTVARTTTAEGRKRDVALGLVPSRGHSVSRSRTPLPAQRQLPSIHNVLAFAPRGWRPYAGKPIR